MSDDTKRKDIGAFWIKTSKAGDKFMSGHIEINGVKHDVVVFKNGYKKEDKHPDYKVYLSNDRPAPADSTRAPVPF